MKTLIAAFLLSFSFAAFAEDPVVCTGNFETPKEMTFSYQDVTGQEVDEGESKPFSVELKNGDETLFSGEVDGTLEDVVLTFKGGDLEGTVFLDELDQTSVTYQGTEYTFNCEMEQ